MKQTLTDCTTTADSLPVSDFTTSEAELLGTEIGDLARRLFCLFALPAGTDTTPRLLTAPEVAEVLKTNTQAVYRLARNRELPAVNLGQRMLRFTEASVYEFVRRGGVGRAA